ncbi:MAG: hypothetical protein E8A12_05880 [Phenylobacterium sp.]|nr:MAG: hypothetical protein E8A12_05880 [Phenylobacterium sp.]
MEHTTMPGRPPRATRSQTLTGSPLQYFMTAPGASRVRCRCCGRWKLKWPPRLMAKSH